MSVLSNVIGRQPGQATGLFGLSFGWPKFARSAVGLLSYVIGAVLAGVVLLVAVATVPTLFGYHTYVVSSGSMEPALRTGSIAVTAPSKPIGLKVGDIIAYDGKSGDTPVLHRIVKIEEVDGERRFTTQGDSNAAPDPTPVTLDGEGDRLVYSVPYAGYVVGLAQGWGGKFLLIGAPAVLLAFITGRDARRRSTRRAEPDAEVKYPRLEQRMSDLEELVTHSLPLAGVATAAARPQPEFDRAYRLLAAPAVEHPGQRALRFVPAARPAVMTRPRELDLHRAPALTFVPRGQAAFTGEPPAFRRVRATPEEHDAA